jgi:hypothetical protein
MSMERLAIWTGVALFYLSAPSAHAQERPLGLYVGAGFGSATVRQAPALDTDYFGQSRNDLGWNAFIGVRPLRYLGAEIGYLDFGNVSQGGPGRGYSLQASAKAPAGFAVGYLPVQPWWDLYLKAGAARLRRTWTTQLFVANFGRAYCPPLAPCPSTAPNPYAYAGAATQWDFAGGVGTQWKFGSIALRLEYERVSTSGNANAGDPDLLSVGVSWTFF